MFAATMAAVLATLVMALSRAVLGPTVYDRILAVNMAGTKTVLLIAVVGFLTGRPDFLDLALTYVFLNFITTIAILKYVEHGSFAVGDGASGGEA
ncbi:MAG: monovalent cation/H+ antiporter complex subunit F [Gemmatimonadota bacterium]